MQSVHFPYWVRWSEGAALKRRFKEGVRHSSYAYTFKLNIQKNVSRCICLS